MLRSSLPVRVALAGSAALLLLAGCGGDDTPQGPHPAVEKFSPPSPGEQGFCEYFRAAVLNTPGTDRNEHPDCYGEIGGFETTTPTP
jgi:hypothetical protein